MPHKHAHKHHSELVSSDLLWEIVRHNNAYLVKRKTGGGVRFSRDPYNLMNVHSRKNAGFINGKGVGLAPAEGEKGGLTLTTKKEQHVQKPGAASHSTKYGGNNPSRKTYKSVANVVAKNHYRPDLRAHAIARASAIIKSQRPVKDDPEKKLRGAKAKKAAAEKDA